MSLLLSSLPAGAQGRSKEGESLTRGPRRHVSTIVFSGIAGAILGLSTLSFYGRPQDRLSNIAVGFAVGVIIGAGFTTYKAATQPRDFYNYDPRRLEPEGWAGLERPVLRPEIMAPLGGWVFSF
jgi:hypothetical protein